MIEFDKYIKIPTPVQKLEDELFVKHGLEVFIKRDDLCHDYISGNKFRKLKYNLIEAKKLGLKNIMSFGGAYSNHIAAVAEAGKLFGFNTLGIIRGDELNESSSPTLARAHEAGMRFEFVNRETYKNKEKLAEKFQKTHFIIPEGGTNILATKGMAELIDEDITYKFDYVATACGTGGTMAGLLSNENFKGKVLGFPVLKGAEFLTKDIFELSKKEPELYFDYHFGGYAKYTTELLELIHIFESKHGIKIEQVYTAKMIYGVHELIKKGYFKPKTRLCLLHTGGLQGRLLELN